MSLSLAQMANVLAHGGSLRIRSAGLSEQELAELARRAKGCGLLTIVVDSMLSEEAMVQIASSGDGAVTFDLTQ
jgi:hypothetical protein